MAGENKKEVKCMCGRYNLFSELQVIAERFQAIEQEGLMVEPRYNIAPGQNITVVISEANKHKLAVLRWGLIPNWAKDPKIGYKMINARAETIDIKPSFKGLLKRKRCLIAADGFYEWKKEGSQKQPYHIHLSNKEPFAFAGLYDEWRNGSEVIRTCTIITTEANMEGIHDRMPVILTQENEKVWLDEDVTETAELKSLMVPYEAAFMNAYPISSFVNNARNEGQGILNSL